MPADYVGYCIPCSHVLATQLNWLVEKNAASFDVELEIEFKIFNVIG